MQRILVKAVFGAVAGGLAPRLVHYVQERLAVRANARVAAPANINSAAAPTAAPSNRQQTPAAPQQHQAPAAVQAAAAAAGASPLNPVPSFDPTTAPTFVPGTSSPTSPGSPSSRAAAGMPHQRLKFKLKKAEKTKLDLLLCDSHKAAFGGDVSDVHWGSAEPSPKPVTEAEDLLRVLLMQPCFMQAGIISRLMCKAAGTAVDDICRGHIPVHLQDSISVDAAQQFAGWAAKHGHLLHSLQLGKGRQGQAAAIAAGLRAAASTNGLCLQQFNSTSEDSSSTALISLLPPAHLTSLKVHLTSARDTQQMAGAILQLKQLQRVTVAALRGLQPKDPAAGASPVLSALSGLSQLSSLHLQRSLPGDAAASILKHLPASLVELRITQSAGHVAQLDLGRLNSLTALQLQGAWQRHGLLRADVLPGQLRVASFHCCASLQPLEDLMMLRVLTLENPPGDELSILKGLIAGVQLTQLRLHYTQSQPTTRVPVTAPAVSADSATGWVALAPCLRVLILTGCELSAPLVHALAHLNRLSSLSLAMCTVTSTIGELGSALKQLSSLQELELEGSAAKLGSDAVKNLPQVTIPPNVPHDYHLRGMAPAVVALKQLLGSIVHISNHAQLRCLRLFLTEMPPVAALAHAANGKRVDGWAPWVVHVAEATQLTRLALGREVLHGIGNKWISRLVPKLTRLQDLRLQPGSGSVYNQAAGQYIIYRPGALTLQAIAKHLQQLTYLDIPPGRLHELVEDLKPLAGLKQLRALGLDDNSCITAESAAATRKELGLPGPLSIKDARHWLSQPDEGW